MRSRNHGVFIILALFLVAATPVLTASEPEPGVARVSLINGEVTSMRGDSGDWVALTVNAPVVSGDKIATGARARTELQLDHANVLRMGQDSEARIADLNRSRIQIQLSRGVLNLTVLKENEADVEVDTPNVAVRPLKEGRYRIQVNKQGETEVIVRKGEAEVYTSDGNVRVKKNDMAVVRGSQADPEYRVMNAPGHDEWDEWNDNRDDTIRNARSYGYTSPYYTGVHDLDRYGRWTYIPGYDWCWAPAADPYWAPYRQGRWVYEPYWGWTWVSYEPWGWAPYHYGRWFSHANAWYWWPGPVHRYYRPHWGPAFVSFFGFGAGRLHFSFGFGWGYNSIGWLPIGPSDYYYPWYGRHRYHYNAVNVTNITNIYNIHNGGAVEPLGRGRPNGHNTRDAFTNPRLRDSITAVGTDDFVSGRIGGRNRRVGDHELRDAQLVAGNPPVVPTRDSLRSSDRSISPTRVSGSERSERMFARRTPPEVRHSFVEGEAGVREMVQKIDPSGGRGNAERGGTFSNSNRLGRTPDRTITIPDRSSDKTAGDRSDRADRPNPDTNSNRLEGGSSRGRIDTGESRQDNTWQRFGRGRTEPRVESDRPRTESGSGSRSTPDRSSESPSNRGGGNRESRELGGSESRPSPGSERRSVEPSPSRSKEEPAPSREPAKRDNRGPSDRPETSGFVTIPRDRSSESGGSSRSSAPNVITIPPRESNRESGTFSTPRGESSGQSGRGSRGSDIRPQFQEAPRSIERSRPENPSRSYESPRINRDTPRIERESPRSYQEAPRSYRQESPRSYQAQPRSESPRSYEAQPRYERSQPRYDSTPSYRAPRSDGGGGGSYRAPRYEGGGGGSSRSAPQGSSRSGGGFSRRQR
ncbi:MAG: hypothetical protein EHM61_20740 [Acidobacteria bacterium]|nr:MAG: hypothetical protein EHM61_20740 [Acidobacteriota bacterium]